MTADQEIRARALECAVRWRHTQGVDQLADPEVLEQNFWSVVKEFEHYIKTGEKG